MTKVIGTPLPVGGVDRNGDVYLFPLDDDIHPVQVTGSGNSRVGLVKCSLTPPTLADGGTVEVQGIDVTSQGEVTQTESANTTLACALVKSPNVLDFPFSPRGLADQ